jgi:NADP-dependent 3-hydroxy acid dehydrogenase YdfG
VSTFCQLTHSEYPTPFILKRSVFMDLFGKVVIVTGASHGIGAAIATAFAAQGSKVILSARSESALDIVADQIGRDTALVVPADITRREEVRALVTTATKTFDRIDILINNAGVGLISPVHTMNDDDLRSTLAVNLFGPLYCIQEIVPVMKARAGGIIMNISSMISRLATPGSGGYRASKCALNAISDAARIELRKYNIRVISVFPGLTATHFFSHCLGNTEKTKVPDGTRLSGRAPEFVARKIVHSARKEPSSVYMTPLSLVYGSIAQIFPQATESLICLRNLFNRS